MNGRIKQLRKALGLTLMEFGNRLGVSNAAVSQWENGSNKVSDGMIRSICREFGVSEAWLRAGEGEMFPPRSRDEVIADFIAGIRADADAGFKRTLLTVLANLSEEQWKTLADIAERFANENQQALAQKQPGEMDIDEKVAAYRRELEAEAEAKDASAASQGIA